MELKKWFISIFLLLCFLLCGCSGISKDVPGETTEAKDSPTNVSQREKLFEYIGLDMSFYDLRESRETEGKISQWWYQNRNDSSMGAYIAIGDIGANDGNGFPEFGDYIESLSGDEEYMLEITIGAVTEDGYMAMNEKTKSYYFVQEGENLVFINLVTY